MALAVAAVTMAGIIASGCSGTGGEAGEPAANDPTVPAPELPATTAVAAPELPAGQDTTVSRVIDGDTIEVAGGVRVRLIGIDAPEISGGACFGTEAAAEARTLLPMAQRVRLVYDVERLDGYGRTLAYVYSLPDGRFVNLILARDGFAVQATFPPNVVNVEAIGAAAADARIARRGLWSACPGAPATSTPAVMAPVTSPPVSSPPVAAPPVTSPSSRGGAGVYYANCTAARAAGAAPVYRGDPGYRPALDRDNDGVGCET